MRKNAIVYFFICLLFLSLQSCSYFGRRKSVSAEKPAQTENMVSQENYDALLSKYDILLRKYRQLTEKSPDLNKLENKNEVSQEASTDLPVSQNKDLTNVGSIEKAIGNFKSALKYKSHKDQSKALAIFNQLKTVSNFQIKVRSYFEIAEILFEQKEYDLAMQTYETIVKNHAQSFYAVKSLNKLSMCMDKLGLEKQKQNYSSLYKSMFN